jgi:hypothetical protein
MEDEPVVEAVAGELAEVLDGLRRVVVEELDRDRACVGLESCLGDGVETLPAGRVSA